ncbi:BatD family protein [Lysobacter solisilvae (ex Woo and Kim 2020)]|uniref:BatD family protein n=1 Tax=Agrilutibacter terrestris TaxID=2865112 RepID=A0A7H0G1L1_9GAMM|nr:BatD family protein [Lysobacter terrestris]QNP42177.1 BatD family protein [Lysobacter terrestris]
MLLALPALAQTRAWVDRDSIAANETVTLNIRTDGMARPDYDPLQRDFSVSGRSSRTEMDGSGVHSLYAVALQPRRAGRLVIPALQVGNARTQPILLQVEAASAPALARAGDDVFIESEADAASPYVQQTVGWVVRLYSAAPLVSGQLDQPAPDGAALQQVGEDVRFTRDVAGRRYEVIERRYQLVPERSGALTIPGAVFEGRGTGGFFEELFGDRGGALSARAPTRVLQVQAAPANAPQPWLPLRSLQLRYTSTPRDLRAGSAGGVVIEAVADGATAAQMPELQLPAIDGVQVFADPVQADETFREGRPRVKLTRRFALVPSQAGAVTLPGLRIDWWDVLAGSRRTATLPPISWNVTDAGGAAGAGAAATDTAATPIARAAARAGLGRAGLARGWVLATLLFAALWLLTLLWALHQRAHHGSHRVQARASGASDTAATPSAHTLADLRCALETGDLGDVGDTLRLMATPPARDVDELLQRLDDPAQRDAVAALQRARWGNGDGARARQALRNAFAKGPKWRRVAASAPALLPPLYPE